VQPDALQRALLEADVDEVRAAEVGVGEAAALEGRVRVEVVGVALREVVEPQVPDAGREDAGGCSGGEMDVVDGRRPSRYGTPPRPPRECGTDERGATRTGCMTGRRSAR
jgi:hypothetical protein